MREAGRQDPGPQGQIVASAAARRLARATLAALLAASGLAFGEPPAASALALAAGAERLARQHAQVGQDVLAASARRGLDEGLRGLESGVRGLIGRTTDPEARESLWLYRLVLEEARAVAARPATRENGRRLHERTEELAWAAERAARRLQSDSTTSALPAPWAAARLALLAERLARERLLERWELGSAAGAAPLAGSIDEAVRTLRGAIAADSDALTELQLAENQLQFLRELPPGRLSAADARTAAKAADNLRESMDRLSRRLQPAPASAPRS